MEPLRLLWGTVLHRPYVYGFFACYLVFAFRHLGARRTAAYTALAYLLAFAAEYSSTRNGFPFGFYAYYDGMRARELWVSNVPFWDSLSFVFLSYFSWSLAAALRRGSWRAGKTWLLAGLLMMSLDIVIDPLTLLGERWFLGRVYDYPQGGTYFGVTLANFAGWWLVGAAIPAAFSALSRWRPLHHSAWREPGPRARLLVYAVYVGVFAFNLGITAWIGEWRLLAASSAFAAAVLLSTGWRLREARRWA